MPSQTEALKDSIPHIEAKGGAEGPFLKGLRQQLSGLEKTAADRQDRQEATRLHAGTRSSAPAAPPPETNPAA